MIGFTRKIGHLFIHVKRLQTYRAVSIAFVITLVLGKTIYKLDDCLTLRLHQLVFISFLIMGNRQNDNQADCSTTHNANGFAADDADYFEHPHAIDVYSGAF